MAIHMQSRVIRSNAPVSAPVDDELVMADVDAGKYYGLNDIATAIWQGLEKEITIEDLCTRLQAVYDVPAERCAMEVLKFVRELEAKGLVQVAG